MKVFLMGPFNAVLDENHKRFNQYEKILTKFFNKRDLVVPDDISRYGNKCQKENPALSTTQICKMRVDFATEQLRQSDLIICDLSRTTIVTGMYLGVAFERNKDVIVCCERMPHLSCVVTGAFPNSIIEYNDLDELSTLLTKALEEKGYSKLKK